MKVAFEGEIMHTQYCIQGKRLEGSFSEHKLGVEIDEYDHVNRDPECKKERRKLIKDHGITFIKTNPDAPDFNINRLKNPIYIHIIKSTKKQTEK